MEDTTFLRYVYCIIYSIVMYGYTGPRKRSTMYGDVDISGDPINKLNLVVTPPDINTSKLFTITNSTGVQTLSLTGDGDINSLGKLTIGITETNNALNSSIAGGYGNFISSAGNSSFIGGGTTNTANSTSVVVGGGDTNNSSGPFAAIVGGQSNLVSVGYGFIGGGSSNQVNGVNSCVAGGGYNIINTGCNYSSIGGGSGNSITSSSYSTIAGGVNHVLNDAAYGVIGGGSINNLGPGVTYGTIAGGYNNTITTSTGASIVGGSSNTCQGIYSQASGFQAKATQTGEQTYACGLFAVQGDCQKSTYWLRTTSAAIGTFTYQLEGSGEITYPATGYSGTCKIMYNSSKNGGFVDCQGGVRRYTFQNNSSTFVDDGASNGTIGVAIITAPVLVMPNATTLRFTVTTLAASAMRHSICVEVYWMRRG